MSIQRATFYVDGMACSSCESRIARTVSGLAGVIRSDVHLRGGTASVEYDDAVIDLVTIKTAIAKIGYSVRDRRGSGTAIALGIGLLLVAAYLLAASSGLFSVLPKVDASVGYAMLFVIGLLTSIHCVAMCGGLALSQSVGLKDSRFSRFRQIVPGLQYNAGRVVSYTSIGALVGAFGAAFSFSPVAKGIIAGIAGLLMVLFGLCMLGLLKAGPLLSGVIPSPIRNAGSRLTSALRKGSPFAVGILNGCMPCGPLQTMQLYALGTGSAFAGALSMFIFSAGTVPLMLLFGVTATFLPRKFLPTMVKASAVLVMFLGVVTFARAATLAGLPVTFNNPAPAAQIAQTTQPEQTVNVGLLKATVSGNVQTVVTEFKNGQYLPFAVQAGIPLQWTIRVTADGLNGCNNPLTVPEYGITKKLVPGDNLIAFTPKKAGTISYSCWMGMVRSSITVSESLGTSIPVQDQSGGSLNFGAAGSASCCFPR